MSSMLITDLEAGDFFVEKGQEKDLDNAALRMVVEDGNLVSYLKQMRTTGIWTFNLHHGGTSYEPSSLEVTKLSEKQVMKLMKTVDVRR